MKITTELVIEKIDRLIDRGNNITHDASFGNTFTHHKFFIGGTIEVFSITSKDVNTIEISVNYKQIKSKIVDYSAVYNHVAELYEEQCRKHTEKEQQEIYNYLTNDN